MVPSRRRGTIRVIEEKSFTNQFNSLVRECPPWCSIVGATVTVHQYFYILHCSLSAWITPQTKEIHRYLITWYNAPLLVNTPLICQIRGDITMSFSRLLLVPLRLGTISRGTWNP